ncbi:glycoside hydrolase family 3 C-terminal domain-containing protein [Flavobacterium sp. MR2016-29]|uniref:beta-glucosidase family protein n=1 Tax=Flavobacterium sp. MR2016-29 TaxID=2783795 RepID=UPI001889E4AD|nr:glycoside hydrolase family 3 C-terminal domain-containing protein [Flavobacterium sp. MR2016-29]MBF4494528.1 glycoside hydrolase family 3 C-terminal domain-containing protein [Flavobacterium sp. MR2016-29]
MKLKFIAAALFSVFFQSSFSQTNATTEKRIQKLIKKMTLKEKVGMLHGNSKFYTEEVKHLGIPEWALSDGPHGVRAEMNRHNWQYAGQTDDASTCFPPGTAMAASWNLELAKQRGIVLGEEARFRKKDVLLGPGINIIRSPLCGRNFEYLSEDPFLISQLSINYIKALQTQDVAACVKHFVANNQEQNRFVVDITVSERALREIYLPGFKSSVVDAGVLGVMGAYNKFRGSYCTENDYLGRTLLRDEFKFKGVYMSDWDAVHSTEKAALAGLDLEMGTEKENYNDWYFADPLINAVQEGRIKESLVDEKVANILRVMIKTKVLDPKTRITGSINTKEHQQAAYRSAVEAVVLLKNEKQILPLNMNAIKSVAIIGDNATRTHCGGGFSSEIKALYEITPFQAMTAKFGKSMQINFAQGYEKQSHVVERSSDGQLNTDKVDWKLIEEAVAQAKKSDVAIIFAGLNHDFDSESFDRLHMRLPYGQETLIQEVAKANPKTIVVIIAGSPLELAGIESRVPAVVWGWYGGMEAGNAVVDVLSGKEFPSGKLPFTIPVTLSQSPAHALGAYPGHDLKVNYEEDILVGYRWFDTKGIEPQHPFGYGLSYTTFDISNVASDKKVYGVNDEIIVKFTIKNTGKTNGAEVVQLYAGQTTASVLRPKKELKAFDKIFLKPGEEKTVALKMKVKDLAFYDEKSNDWKVEPGEFVFYTGTSSENIVNSLAIMVQ